MKPTYEELLESHATWRKSHEGVTYSLSFHGYRVSEDHLMSSEGTWCYYLIIPEQMYPHRWQDFACVRHESGGREHGPAFEHDFFDSEITWASSEPYFDRKEKRSFDASKVGCDYAHLWHQEMGYPDTYQSVNADAIQTVEKFLKAHPDRLLKSSYSGKWGTPNQFYTARNGALVFKEDDIPDEWEQWRPATAEPVNGAIQA